MCILFDGSYYFDNQKLHKNHATSTVFQIRSLCAEETIHISLYSDEYYKSLDQLHITSINLTNTEDTLIFSADIELADY